MEHVLQIILLYKMSHFYQVKFLRQVNEYLKSYKQQIELQQIQKKGHIEKLFLNHDTRFLPLLPLKEILVVKTL